MTPRYTHFDEIPQFTREAEYRTSVRWTSIERNLEELTQPHGLDLDPDFQRGHVWTPRQQVRYVEFVLRGGKTGRDILFNQSGFQAVSREGDRGEPMTLVDGKQRLTAVRRFLANEIPAFGTYFGDYEGRLSVTGPMFFFVINNLPTRAEVLQWYLDLNSGGVVHSDEEITRVQALLAEENTLTAGSVGLRR